MKILPPKIVKNKKSGKRYLVVGKHRYIIKSTASDRYLVKNFFDIIKQLIANKKRRYHTRKSKPKSKSLEHKQPEASGNSADLANILKYQKLNAEDFRQKAEQPKIENKSEKDNDKQLLLTNIENDVSHQQSLLEKIKQSMIVANEQAVNQETKYADLLKESNLLDKQIAEAKAFQKDLQDQVVALEDQITINNKNLQDTIEQLELAKKDEKKLKELIKELRENLSENKALYEENLTKENTMKEYLLVLQLEIDKLEQIKAELIINQKEKQEIIQALNDDLSIAEITNNNMKRALQETDAKTKINRVFYPLATLQNLQDIDNLFYDGQIAKSLTTKPVLKRDFMDLLEEIQDPIFVEIFTHIKKNTTTKKDIDKYIKNTKKAKKISDETNNELEQTTPTKQQTHYLKETTSSASKKKDKEYTSKSSHSKNYGKTNKLKSPYSGAGLADNHSGLWNYEIDSLMDRYSRYGFLGVYSIDQLNLIQTPNKPAISFIMNIMPSTVKAGHWVAVYINKENLEYYDPLGQPPPKDFEHNIQPILHKFAPNSSLQFKINTIRYQRTNSNNCGWFAMKFLVDRYKHKKFKEATGFSKLIDSVKGENEIKQFKKQFNIKEFQNLTT